MKKYAVKLTHGDDVEILGVKGTKEQAMELGMELRKQHSRDAGFLAVIEAEFDNDNNLLGNAYRLLEVIR